MKGSWGVKDMRRDWKGLTWGRVEKGRGTRMGRNVILKKLLHCSARASSIVDYHILEVIGRHDNVWALYH